MKRGRWKGVALLCSEKRSVKKYIVRDEMQVRLARKLVNSLVPSRNERVQTRPEWCLLLGHATRPLVGTRGSGLAIYGGPRDGRERDGGSKSASG